MRHLAGAIAVTCTALVGGALVAVPAAAAGAADPVEVRPERTVRPAGVQNPQHIHLTSSGRLFVLHDKRAQVLVYGANARRTSRPIYRIAGRRTGLARPTGIARDADGRLYVGSGSRVLVFGKKARGNVRPIRVLRLGMKLGTAAMPGTVRVHGNKLLVVGTDGVKVFRRTAKGAATPLQHLRGDKTGLQHAVDVNLNVDGRIWAAFPDGERARVFAPGATGNATPELSPPAFDPQKIAFDRAGRVYLAAYDGEVRVLPADARAYLAPLFLLGYRWGATPGGLSVSSTGKVAAGDLRSVRIYPRLLPVTRPWAVRSASVSGASTAARRVVRWRAPAADGGAAVTRFQIVVKRGDRVVRVVRLKAGRRSYALTRRGLPAGTVTILVKARNRKGYGPAVSVPITVVK
ncbi:hypothetical protein FE697_017170 [Mumia zhuanghuii]|uniref:Fibronectin type-III domain-containing protein n=2 Tax=Mumia TaxID=1546255 RepID=A0ABW1QNP9_9ACTN|nr:MULTISPECIES: hypothetical protein [Mumia]KAA1420674.1 hypothetical protein FE697_017170 [Mumia zhuanghuii]